MRTKSNLFEDKKAYEKRNMKDKYTKITIRRILS